MFLLWELHMRNSIIRFFLKVILSMRMFVMFWREYFVLLLTCHFLLVFRVSSSESRFPIDCWFLCVLSCVLIQGPVLQNNLRSTVASSLHVQQNYSVTPSRIWPILVSNLQIYSFKFTASLALLVKDLFRSLISSLILMGHV